MSDGRTDSDLTQPWESAHICPNCGHTIALAQLDLRAITTGIVTCPECDWAGKIEIRVVEERQIKL